MFRAGSWCRRGYKYALHHLLSCSYECRLHCRYRCCCRKTLAVYPFPKSECDRDSSSGCPARRRRWSDGDNGDVHFLSTFEDHTERHITPNTAGSSHALYLYCTTSAPVVSSIVQTKPPSAHAEGGKETNCYSFLEEE